MSTRPFGYACPGAASKPLTDPTATPASAVQPSVFECSDVSRYDSVGVPIQNNQTLLWNSASSTFKAGSASAATSLMNLSDVTTSPPLSQGNVLTYQQGAGLWTNAPAPTSATAPAPSLSLETFALNNTSSATLRYVTLTNPPVGNGQVVALTTLGVPTLDYTQVHKLRVNINTYSGTLDSQLINVNAGEKWYLSKQKRAGITTDAFYYFAITNKNLDGSGLFWIFDIGTPNTGSGTFTEGMLVSLDKYIPGVIGELGDVIFSTAPTNNQVLTYDSGISAWKSATASATDANAWHKGGDAFGAGNTTLGNTSGAVLIGAKLDSTPIVAGEESINISPQIGLGSSIVIPSTTVNEIQMSCAGDLWVRGLTNTTVSDPACTNFLINEATNMNVRTKDNGLTIFTTNDVATNVVKIGGVQTASDYATKAKVTPSALINTQAVTDLLATKATIGGDTASSTYNIGTNNAQTTKLTMNGVAGVELNSAGYTAIQPVGINGVSILQPNDGQTIELYAQDATNAHIDLLVRTSAGTGYIRGPADSTTYATRVATLDRAIPNIKAVKNAITSGITGKATIGGDANFVGDYVLGTNAISTGSVGLKCNGGAPFVEANPTGNTILRGIGQNILIYNGTADKSITLNAGDGANTDIQLQVADAGTGLVTSGVGTINYATKSLASDLGVVNSYTLKNGTATIFNKVLDDATTTFGKQSFAKFGRFDLSLLTNSGPTRVLSFPDVSGNLVVSPSQPGIVSIGSSDANTVSIKRNGTNFINMDNTNNLTINPAGTADIVSTGNFSAGTAVGSGTVSLKRNNVTYHTIDASDNLTINPLGTSSHLSTGNYIAGTSGAGTVTLRRNNTVYQTMDASNNLTINPTGTGSVISAGAFNMGSSGASAVSLLRNNVNFLNIDTSDVLTLNPVGNANISGRILTLTSSGVGSFPMNFNLADNGQVFNFQNQGTNYVQLVALGSQNRLRTTVAGQFISLETVATATSTTTGQIFILSGNNTGLGSTGLVSITSGNALGSTGNSGDANFTTGNATSGSSGTLTCSSGACSFAGATSGPVIVSTGAGSVEGNITGPLTLKTGNTSAASTNGTGGVGNVNISCGTPQSAGNPRAGGTVNITSTRGVNGSSTHGNINLFTNSTTSGVVVTSRATKLLNLDNVNLTADRTLITADRAGTNVVSTIDMPITFASNPVYGIPLSYNSTTAAWGTDTQQWKDLIGDMALRAGGGSNPLVVSQFDVAGNYYEYATNTGNGATSQAFFTYHIPHDYILGTDLFIHMHTAIITADTTVGSWVCRAGFAQSGAVFPALTTVGNISTTYNGTARTHFVTEIQLSNAGGTGGLLNTASIDTDGLVQVQLIRTQGVAPDTLPGPTAIFVHSVDLHYLAVTGGTKAKVAPFR